MPPIYAATTDVTDPALTMTDDYLYKADDYVNADLLARGIDPDDVTLPNAILKQLAIAYACRLMAMELTISDNSQFIYKAEQYKSLIAELQTSLTRSALGIITDPTGIGSIDIGRG